MNSHTPDISKAKRVHQMSSWVAFSWPGITVMLHAAAPPLKHPSYLIMQLSQEPLDSKLTAITHHSHSARIIFQANMEIQENSLLFSLLHVAQKVWSHTGAITCWTKKKKSYFCRSFKNNFWGSIVTFAFIYHDWKFLLSQVNSKGFHEASCSLQRVTIIHALGIHDPC